MSSVQSYFNRGEEKRNVNLPVIPADIVDAMLPEMSADIGKGLGYRVAYVEGRGKRQMVIVIDASEPARYVDTTDHGKDVIGRAFFVDAGRGVACLEDRNGETVVLSMSAYEPNRVYRARADALGKGTTLSDK